MYLSSSMFLISLKFFLQAAKPVLHYMKQLLHKEPCSPLKPEISLQKQVIVKLYNRHWLAKIMWSLKNFFLKKSKTFFAYTIFFSAKFLIIWPALISIIFRFLCDIYEKSKFVRKLFTLGGLQANISYLPKLEFFLPYEYSNV